MVCYCLLYFCYVVRGNVCYIILYDFPYDTVFFCYMASYMMLFLVDFCCSLFLGDFVVKFAWAKRHAMDSISEQSWKYRGMM